MGLHVSVRRILLVSFHGYLRIVTKRCETILFYKYIITVVFFNYYAITVHQLPRERPVILILRR